MYLQMKLIKTGQNRNCCCNKFENNCKIISSEFKENVINALYKVVANIVKGGNGQNYENQNVENQKELRK